MRVVIGCHRAVDMLTRIATILFGLNVLLAAAPACAQVFDGGARELLRNMQRQPNDLARYVYLLQAMPGLSSRNRQLAAQFFSFSQCELGLYTQAVLSFPLSIDAPSKLDLPRPDQWRGVPAADAIAAMARDRRIVMVNEAHHNAHTRQLTLELLPRLRALGFNYFAAEALLPTDARLSKRGYPVKRSGTEYLREPLYGEIVRSALRLGYHVIAYDAGTSGQARERQQARNLYRQVFAQDPSARLFVHAGYAHIDKAPGRLADMEPMGMILKQLSGHEPLSIDQTEFMEVGWDQGDAYHRLIKAFPTTQPEVLLSRADGKPWSAQPTQYDVNVILPASVSMAAFGVTPSTLAEPAARATVPHDATRETPPSIMSVILRPLQSTAAFGQDPGPGGEPGMRTGRSRGSPRQAAPALVASTLMQRPSWLALDGQRHPFPISTALCKSITPCVVEALYANESDNAIAADRYAFMADHRSSTLYLRPGNYQLRASNIFGAILSAKKVDIPVQRDVSDAPTRAHRASTSLRAKAIIAGKWNARCPSCLSWLNASKTGPQAKTNCHR